MRRVTADAFRNVSLCTGVVRNIYMRVYRSAVRLHLNIFPDKRLIRTMTFQAIVLQHGAGVNSYGKQRNSRTACNLQIHVFFSKSRADGLSNANRRPKTHPSYAFLAMNSPAMRPDVMPPATPPG